MSVAVKDPEVRVKVSSFGPKAYGFGPRVGATTYRSRGQ